MKIFFIFILLFFCNCSPRIEEPVVPTPAQPVVKLFEALNDRDSAALVNIVSDSLQNHRNLYDDMSFQAFCDSLGKKHFLIKINKVVIDPSFSETATVYFSVTETKVKNKTVDSLYMCTVKENNAWKLSSIKFEHQ
jgi:hypothetical protein